MPTKKQLEATIVEMQQEIDGLLAASTPSAFVRFCAAGFVPGGVVSDGMVMENPDPSVLREIPHVLISEDEYCGAPAARVFGAPRVGIPSTTVMDTPRTASGHVSIAPTRPTVTRS